ncbi:MAG: tyrosine-type recombinase/integrase [Candidatus Aminicenantes bacterium]|nr:tyrosine-type recombinase/integrase [Candidatus Aminicenantes bacterium]
MKYFRRVFETASRRAGIKGLTLHDIRHTFASRLVRAGVDLITVKDLLGHYSVKTTERYIHSNKEQKRKALSFWTKKGLENLRKTCKICHSHSDENGDLPVPLTSLLSETWAVSSVGRARRSHEKNREDE